MILENYLNYIVNPHMIEKFVCFFFNKQISSLFSIKKLILSFNTSSETLYNNPFSFYMHMMFLELIAGQKLKLISSKKQISDFNLKKKLKFGGITTLRSKSLYSFLLKFILINQFELYNFKGFLNLSTSSNSNISFGFNTLDCFDPIFTTYEQWAFMNDSLRYGIHIDIVNNYSNSFVNEVLLSHMGFFFYNDHTY